MRNPLVRRFGIADGLILVAATAFGLAASRFVFASREARAQISNVSDLLRRAPSGWTVSDVLECIAIAGVLLSPCLMTWTPACLILRGRGPRPIRRRLRWPPGTLACVVATGTVLLSGAIIAAIGGYKLRTGRSHDAWTVYVVLLVSASIQASAAVPWCWATLWLCGRWRPERSWLDRLGRLLGVTWIALGMFCWLLFAFELL
jgi:hypothetical protein